MKKFLIGLVVVLIIIIFGLVVYLKTNNPILIDDTAMAGRSTCTKEVKICPDGSVVGRQGPNCEFEQCSFTPDTINEETGS